MKSKIIILLYMAMSISLINLTVLPVEVVAEEDVIFRDDFMGKSLRPEWEVMAKDTNRMALIDNEYLLLVTYGPFASAKNRMIYKGDLPENYEISIKIDATPELHFQGVSLGISQDSKNYLTNYYYIDAVNVARTYFSKELKGESSDYKNKTDLPKGKLLFLKLEKKGIEYSGYYSPDGASWSKIGTHVFINLRGRPYFIVWNSKKKAPETGIRIDYFEIKKID